MLDKDLKYSSSRFFILTDWFITVVLDVVLLCHWEEWTLVARVQHIIVIAGIACWLAGLAIITERVSQCLLDLNSLSLLKLVLLLEGVVSHDFMVNTVIKLSIVVKFILSVDFTAFLWEAEDLLLDFHQLLDLRLLIFDEVNALLAHGRVERR